MIPVPTGRNRQYDIELNGYPFLVARSKGIPQWSVPRHPDIEGQSQSSGDVPRAYNSCHSGFGWSQYQAPNTYHLATNLDPRYPGQLIMGPLVTPVTQATQGGAVTGFFEGIGGSASYLFTLSGRYCNRIDPSNDSVAAAGGFPHDFGAGTVSTIGVRFDGNVIIGFTGGATEIVKFDGTNFTADVNSLYGAYLAKFWADTDYALAQTFLSGANPSVAWCAQGANPFVSSGTNNWSGADGSYPIGDSGSTITGMAAVERTLFFGKTDGLYYLDGRTSRSPCLVPVIPVDSNNGVNTTADSQGRIWYPSKSGLYLYDPSQGTIDDVSPGRGLSDRSGIQGLKTAIAHLRSWTYVSVYDGTDSYIMAGRRREDGEPGFGPYIWHGALAKITSAKVTSMFISSLVAPPRLWFGLSTGSVSYIKLPANGDNPWLDSAYRYSASGSIRFPADEFGVPGMRWNLSDLVLEAYGLSASTTVQVYERRNATPTNYSADSGWTSLQTISADGRTVISPTGDKRFNRCELRLDLVNGVSTSSPVVRVLAAKASRRPTMRDVIECTVLLYDEALSRMGIQTRYTAKDLADQLDTLDTYYPVSLVDYWHGSAQTRTVQVVSLHKRVIKQDEDRAAGLAADLVLKVVA